MFAQSTPLTLNTISTATWIWIAVAAVIVIAIIAMITRQHRADTLRKRSGAEDDRMVTAAGSSSLAEVDVARREKRAIALDIHPLTPGARARYSETWRATQVRFVDDPQSAVAEANRLLNDVMRDRGYPADPNLTLEDLSVDHARVVNDYRMANAIAGKSDTTTEELRHLIINVRNLFAELIEKDPMATADAPNASVPVIQGHVIEPRRIRETEQVRA
jgi:hypothetical protein